MKYEFLNLVGEKITLTDENSSSSYGVPIAIINDRPYSKEELGRRPGCDLMEIALHCGEANGHSKNSDVFKLADKFLNS